MCGVLGLLSLATASEGVASCSKLMLRHNGGIDGQDMNGDPKTRFHVAGSSGEEVCLSKNSIVDVQAHFYGDIEGTLKGPLVASSSDGLLKDTVLVVDVPAGAAREVKVVQIVPCAGKGSVGSGTPGLCCEGLQSRYAFDPKTCEPLDGGYKCLDCGDGRCEKGLEDRCNCPEDCK